MDKSQDTDRLERAKTLMDNFAKRTGIAKGSSETDRRYLWTDAFALLNFIALKHQTQESKYDDYARTLIEHVHQVLGQFAAKDEREGWISGLPKEKAVEHPTVNGLRIGKELPERREDQPYDQQLEWNRDGQYYHYHTRWIKALSKASAHFENEKFSRWSRELSLAGSKFIAKNNTDLKMYWKMSVDLSRPLVPVMGAHDPLDGLLCALQVTEKNNIEKEFEDYIQNLKTLCDFSSWATSDPLGAGGLLLNAVKSVELHKKVELPTSVQPKKLLKDVEQSLEAMDRSVDPEESANYRLAFRECGLSLGLRCLQGKLDLLNDHGLKPTINSKLWTLALQLEDFWLEDKHTKTASYQDHLDINDVSLAASILASEHPDIYV